MLTRPTPSAFPTRAVALPASFRRLLARAGRLARKLWPLWWLGLGWWLRVLSFGRFPLREDEALYAYWARLISSGKDPMLERVAVDKPPFFIYSLAHLFTAFGPSEAVGRWLNVGCSMLALLLLWLLARRLYGRTTAHLALALYAISPFAISFAPTLYTDPMLVAWLLLALVCAAYGLGLAAGLAAGMAFATKQNALLFLPLVVAVLALARAWRWPGRVGRALPEPRGTAARVLRMAGFAGGFAYTWYKVWQWDGWRILPAEIPSFWQQAWNSYGGLHRVPVQQWGERGLAWWGVVRWLGGWLPGTMILLGLAGLALAAALRRRGRPGDARGAIWDRLLGGFVLGYLGLHVVLSFQPWDRYLLGLAPVLALLAARGVLYGRRALGEGGLRRGVAAALVASTLLWGAWLAATARIPVGGDHGAYTGIDVVAAYLRTAVPAQRGVLYHRWLGWHWNWYLWDGPQGRVYWSDPEMLVTDIRRNPYGYRRFIVFPAWHLAERDPVEAALRDIGFQMQERLRVRAGDEVRFVVFQILPEVQP
ncbi:MAG: hypothetical protein D6775_07300 [Caldilineae bacterium]|nr:MAG: hypothetical protein D6775_07300 [Caldilineae bacterium]